MNTGSSSVKGAVGASVIHVLIEEVTRRGHDHGAAPFLGIPLDIAVTDPGAEIPIGAVQKIDYR